MKGTINQFFDVLGAVVLLAALAVVARNPEVVTGTLREFGGLLKVAKA